MKCELSEIKQNYETAHLVLILLSFQRLSLCGLMVSPEAGIRKRSNGSYLSVKTQVRISPQWRVPGLSEWEGVEQSPNLIPSLYKPRGNHRPERRTGQPRVCSPWTLPECLPCGLILSGHSVTVGPLMDHLRQHICIFPLSVIGR